MRNRTEGGTHPVKLPASGNDAGHSDPLIGQLIQDRYRLSSRLAAGSTGRLYRAHDIRDLTEVTVKLLPDRFDGDDRLIASIRAELSRTGTLASTRPALAAVYDLQRLRDGGALVVMEPLDGTSLADIIREKAPLPVDRALHLALQIAEALETAHNAAFVHGALEAEHVLIDSRDAVKVTGFEVARFEGARRGPRSSEITGRSLLSAISKQPAEEADYRGVGRILHDLLASVERPDVGVEGAEPRRKLGRHVPPTVRRLVVEMVAEGPKRSGRDMSGLANLLWVALDRVSGGPVARAWRRWRRIGAFAAVVAATVITALGIWMMQPPSPSSRPVAASPEATATRPTLPAATSSAAPSPAVRVPEPLVEPPLAPPPSTVEVPAARPARTQPRVTVGSPRTPEPSVLLPPPPAASVVAQPAPPAGESAAPRREPQEPDPSAVIDWLLNEYRSQRP